MSVTAQQRLAAQWPAERHGEDLSVRGVVSGLPEHSGDQWRFMFRSEAPAGLIRVAWYRSDAELEAGQCWQLKLRMRTPRGSVNPGAFDYEGWLFGKGIIATAYVRQAERCKGGISQGFWLLRLRQAWVERLRDTLGGHAGTAAALALTLGARDGFTQADWDLLRRTGTSHLMAISGLHIGIVAGWLFLLGSLIWRVHPVLLRWLPARKAAILFSGLGAGGYAVISGFELPAQRALIMLLAFYWALWSARRISPAHSLTLALLAVLLLDPLAVGSPGFWLSFGAVAWIFYLLAYRWRPPGRLTGYLRLQCMLGLALVPLTLYWFGEASWIAPLVNLLLIPVFSCLVPLLFAAVLLLPLWPQGGAWLLHLGADALALIWQGLSWSEQLGPPVFAANASLWVVIAMLAGLLWFSAPRGWPARGAGLLLCLPLLVPLPQSPRTGDFRLTVLDVGQGLAVVAETAGHVLVYDAGPAYAGGFDAGAMVVLPYLRSRGYGRVDAVVQSHADLDHRGGMPAVEAAMRIGRRYGFDEHAPCRKGMQWRWDGVLFEFLHPDSPHWTGNDSSCVLKISAGDYAALLSGDIEARVERHLLANQRALLAADVLVAPHHGSASSSSPAFVRAVAPRIAIFSAGWRNRWDFPRPGVMRRYTRSRLYSTAQHGALQLRVSAASGVSRPLTWRQHDRRLWRSPADPGWPDMGSD